MASPASATALRRPKLFSAAAIPLFVIAEVLALLWGWNAGTFLGPLLAAFLVLFAVVAYRNPDVAWMLTWIAAPLSMEARLPGGVAVAVPTEPMMVLSLGAWLLRAVPSGAVRLGPRSIARPLAAIAAIALISVIWSEHILVGVKAWSASALYVAFGYLYFVSTDCDSRRAGRWLLLAAGLGALLAIYGSVRALSTGLDLRAGYGAARPFFPEHGTFGAYLAMLLPVALLEAMDHRGTRRLLWVLGATLLALGLALSYTRAAWVSVAVVVPPLLILWAARRGRPRRLLVPGVIVLILVSILGLVGVGDRLSRHAATIVQGENVSNLERLNRWMAAWEMVRADPLTGVGYGAYPDSYPRYRRKAIVTWEVYGRFGAHSEPIRMLSETGWPGLLAAVWLFGSVLAAGVGIFLRSPENLNGRLALGLAAGLATYGVHALFNSYLGIDKVTLPFWVAVGGIATIAGDEGRRRALGLGEARGTPVS